MWNNTDISYNNIKLLTLVTQKKKKLRKHHYKHNIIFELEQDYVLILFSYVETHISNSNNEMEQKRKQK